MELLYYIYGDFANDWRAFVPPRLPRAGRAAERTAGAIPIPSAPHGVRTEQAAVFRGGGNDGNAKRTAAEKAAQLSMFFSLLFRNQLTAFLPSSPP